MKFLINNAFKMSRPLRGLDISKHYLFEISLNWFHFPMLPSYFLDPIGMQQIIKPSLMEVFYASRFFLSFGCHSLLEAKKQQKMRQGDIGKWQEDTENVFRVPLPFSNVPLPHFLPPLAFKKAVKKMGMEFIYYHKIHFIFINACYF